MGNPSIMEAPFLWFEHCSWFDMFPDVQKGFCSPLSWLVFRSNIFLIEVIWAGHLLCQSKLRTNLVWLSKRSQNGSSSGWWRIMCTFLGKLCGLAFSYYSRPLSGILLTLWFSNIYVCLIFCCEKNLIPQLRSFCCVDPCFSHSVIMAYIYISPQTRYNATNNWKFLIIIADGYTHIPNQYWRCNRKIGTLRRKYFKAAWNSCPIIATIS